jgi:hypothetical protein
MPEYEALTSRATEAVLEFGEAWIAHQSWVNEVRREGVIYAGLGVLFPLEDTLLFQLLRLLEWASECGHIDHSAIPKKWREWRATGDSRHL